MRTSILVVALAFVAMALPAARVEYDTRVLLDSVDGLLQCFGAGRWIGCPYARQWPVAVLQYLPSVVLRAGGMPPDDVGLLWAGVSFVAYLGILVASYRTLTQRGHVVAIAALLVLGVGQLVHYATSSFGEMPAAFVVTAFVALWLVRGPAPAIGACALLATVSKDTAFPLVAVAAALCLTALRDPRDRARALLVAERDRIVAAATGTAAGLALQVGVNLVRFGVPYNEGYVRWAACAPSPTTQVRLAAALWMAPNAGLLFFWPTLTIAFVAVAMIVLRDAHARRGPLAAGASLLGLLTVGLSGWWSPFGWYAWGSRLIVPWLPALLLALFWTYADVVTRIARTVAGTRVRAACLATMLATLSLPHVASLFRADALMHWTFDVRGRCGVPWTPKSHPVYYRCLEALAWEPPLTLGAGYRAAFESGVRYRVVVFVALVGLGCAELWRSTRESV